jgi:hypothetical protein
VSGIGGWLGTGAALIVIGLCFLLMRFGHHLPQVSHPWQHRLVIVLMYAAGAVLIYTTVGAWALHTLESLGGFAGGTAPGSGIGWSLVTIGALFMFVTVVVALVWVPDTSVAYMAMATPLMLALAPPGGVANQIYAFTAGPAQQLVAQVAHWAGG